MASSARRDLPVLVIVYVHLGQVNINFNIAEFCFSIWVDTQNSGEGSDLRILPEEQGFIFPSVVEKQENKCGNNQWIL